MAVGVPTETLLVVAGVVAFGRLIEGVAGFGYGVASTAILATVLSPATAVVVMILPALAANASLLGELDREGLRSCAERFRPYLGAALVGTPRDGVPRRYPSGPLALGYVLLKQPHVALPGADRVVTLCLRPGRGGKAGLGFVSGVGSVRTYLRAANLRPIRSPTEGYRASGGVSTRNMRTLMCGRYDTM